MTLKKISIVIIIIIIVLIAIFALSFFANKKIDKTLNKEAGTNVEEDNNYEDPIKKPISELELMLMDFESRIAEVEKQKPSSNARWKINVFWVGPNNDFYVEYTDGTVAKRLLIHPQKTDNKWFYNIIGAFEPGEDDWILVEGDDTLQGETLDLYLFDDKIGRWIKQN